MPSILPSCAELALPAPAPLQPAFALDSFVICRGAIAAERAAQWRMQALDLVARYARRIEQESQEHVLRYRVITGEIIRTEWPELFAFYQSPGLRDWVARVTGVPAIFTSSHERSAINVNALGEPGEVYRWHHDAAGFTLLLYLTESASVDGGALELRPPDRDDAISILPEAGMAVLMDGTQCLHRAAPVLRRHDRISIPMVFTSAPDHDRPAGLDDYLYR